MVRLVLLIVFVLLVTATALAIKSCTKDDPAAAPPMSRDSGLVSLDDGSTMIAPDGTVGRELVDWMAQSSPQQRLFELGGEEFVDRTAEPTLESRSRIPRLVAMLRANPDVDLVIVGHSDPSADPQADLALSLLRAQTLLGLLEEGGVEARRMRAEGRGAAEPIADNATAEGRSRNQRVTLLLSSRGR